MNVGDYVRTKYGITQFKEYETTNGEKFLCMPVKDGSQGIFANIEDVVKSSPNIIDLIEVGDIVNYGLLGGGMVIFKKDGGITTNTILFSNLKEKDIKKVITKEQIENIEYEVE